MGLVHDIILPTGPGKVWPVLIEYSAIAESGFTSTGAMAANATMALGWKPTAVDLTKPLSDQTNHYLLTIRKVGTTVTVWKQDVELGSYTTTATTYAGLLTEALTAFAGAAKGYVSRLVVVESALDFTSFYQLSGRVAGLWVPKALTGLVPHTLLDFSNAADLGHDSSGNGNDWTLTSPVQSTDTPTDNHATWNPFNPEDLGYSNGNKSVSSATSAIGCAYTTYCFPVEEDYALELRIDTGSAAGVGVTNELKYNNAINQPEAVIYLPNGSIRTGGADTPYGETWATGDVIKAKVSGGVLSFEKNGVDQGVAASGLTGTYWFLFQDSSTNYIAEGTILSTTLTAANLPEPDVLDTSLFADIVLREGTGADVAIDSLKFPPDWVNIKNRNAAYAWRLFDTARGVLNAIRTDAYFVEESLPEGLKSFDLNGYTLGSHIDINELSSNYVDLAILADSAIGFEIHAVSHTNGAQTTFNHTLGRPVTFAVTKNLDSNNSWWTYHTALGPNKYLQVSETGAAVSSTNIWPVNTSTQFALGSACITGNYIVYLFTDSDMFKAFSFTGNGNANGPFIDLGGRFLSIPFLKNSSIESAWLNWDTVRQLTNSMGNTLCPDTNNVEFTYPYASVLSSGFKPIVGGTSGYAITANGNGNLIVGLAILRQPQKYANAF